MCIHKENTLNKVFCLIVRACPVSHYENEIIPPWGKSLKPVQTCVLFKDLII